MGLFGGFDRLDLGRVRWGEVAGWSWVWSWVVLGLLGTSRELGPWGSLGRLFRFWITAYGRISRSGND